MIKFTGPNSIKFPHGRLLYIKEESASEAWKNLSLNLSKIDKTVELHPRLNYAHSDSFLYFFGSDAKEVWVGREIVGHLAKAPTGMHLFDSFQGDGFEWNTSLREVFQASGGEVLNQGEKLKSLAGESLAKTWRVKIGPMEEGSPKSLIRENEGGQPFKISFQFYKMG